MERVDRASVVRKRASLPARAVMEPLPVTVLVLATVLAMGLAASALAQGPRGAGETPSVLDPTLPPALPCPSVDVPRLGPDVGDTPIGATMPLATSAPMGRMAAPSVGPEPCPSPLPLGPEPRPVHGLGRGLESPSPSTLQVDPLDQLSSPAP